jgi:LysM repeat protein
MADDLFPDKDKKDKVDKTTWIYIALAAAALVLTYLIYEHGKSTSSASSGSSSGPTVDPSLLNPSVAGSTYEPGTELQAYQQGLQDAFALVQAQPGTGAESSSATTTSASSGANTSSATTAVSSSGTTASAPTPAPVSHPSQRTVTVASGDTLWGLARQYGVSESSLYNANAGVLNSAAQQNGFANSAGGSRIWPGERLVIP